MEMESPKLFAKWATQSPLTHRAYLSTSKLLHQVENNFPLAGLQGSELEAFMLLWVLRTYRLDSAAQNLCVLFTRCEVTRACWRRSAALVWIKAGFCNVFPNFSLLLFLWKTSGYVGLAAAPQGWFGLCWGAWAWERGRLWALPWVLSEGTDCGCFTAGCSGSVVWRIHRAFYKGEERMYFVVLPWKQVASQSLCRERYLIFSCSNLFLQPVLGDVGSYDNMRWIMLKRGCGVMFEGGHPSRNEERISRFPLYNEPVFSCTCWQCLRAQSWDALPCFRKNNIFFPLVCLP